LQTTLVSSGFIVQSIVPVASPTTSSPPSTTSTAVQPDNFGSDKGSGFDKVGVAVGVTFGGLALIAILVTIVIVLRKQFYVEPRTTSFGWRFVRRNVQTAEVPM